MRTNLDNISFVNISKTGGSILKKKVMLAASMLLMVGGLSACGLNKEKILQKTIQEDFDGSGRNVYERSVSIKG